jgi:hypothetical protein
VIGRSCFNAASRNTTAQARALRIARAEQIIRWISSRMARRSAL